MYTNGVYLECCDVCRNSREMCEKCILLNDIEPKDVICKTCRDAPTECESCLKDYEEGFFPCCEYNRECDDCEDCEKLIESNEKAYNECEVCAKLEKAYQTRRAEYGVRMEKIIKEHNAKNHKIYGFLAAFVFGGVVGNIIGYIRNKKEDEDEDINV